MRPAVASSFDVAYWFIDQALNDGEYLQPHKMHRLMYLAQAFYAVANQGRMLMPAVFVAHAFGPVEPNVFRACAIARPAVEAEPMDDEAQRFLEGIWRKFGALSADSLNRRIAQHSPYAQALAAGEGSEIPLAAMVDFYSRRVSAAAGSPKAPTPAPRVLRAQDGRAVAVAKWQPPAKGRAPSGGAS